MADYEILSEATLNKLKISKDIFLQSIESSVQAFKTTSPQIDSFMLTQLCDGLTNWQNLYTHYRERFRQGDFGKSKLTTEKLIEIATSRQDFYERWFGPQNSFEDYISILLDQGAEYAVVGNLVAKHYPNCLIMGADSSLFAEFYCIDKRIPSLYLKRYYV